MTTIVGVDQAAANVRWLTEISRDYAERPVNPSSSAASTPPP
jgi:hypothetical protein